MIPNLRRSFFWVASAGLTVFLVVLLIKISKLDLHVTAQQLKSVSWFSFAKLALLNGVLVYLSTEKWRSIDAAWRRSGDSVPSWTKSYALTSVGLALGIVLPVQLAMSTARTIGTHVHGRSIKRGTAGTLFEQSFDMITVGFLAVASGITRLYKGGGLMWTTLAVAAIAIALLVAGPFIRLIRWRSERRSDITDAPQNRLETVLRGFSELRRSGLLNVPLARRLIILSVLRFCVVVLMSIETAEAIHVRIPIWQMAAAVPFVVMASVIALTPGGLGINELTSVTALKIFGTPLAVGAQWALANRILIAASYFFVATCAVVVLTAQRLVSPATSVSLSGQEDDTVESRQPL